MELGIYKGKNGQCIILNRWRITTPKIYGILKPVQTWDVAAYDILDAIPFGTIKAYVQRKISEENGWG